MYHATAPVHETFSHTEKRNPDAPVCGQTTAILPKTVSSLEHLREVLLGLNTRLDGLAIALGVPNDPRPAVAPKNQTDPTVVSKIEELLTENLSLAVLTESLLRQVQSRLV